MDPEILEVIADTISELQATCRITLYDIYGSVDGFHTSDFNTEEAENALYDPQANRRSN